MRVKARAVSAVAVCAAVALASGCGSGSGSSSSSSSGGGSGATGGKGQTLILAVNSLPDNLTTNPWGGVASHVVLTGLGPTLAGYDGSSLPGNGCDQPATGANIAGRLAQSIEFTPDRKAVRVVLKPLKSPTGNTLSGEDVKWSFERQLKTDPVVGSSLAAGGYDIKNLTKVIDAHTVELNVTKPTSYTIESLQNNLNLIYDSTEAKKHATPKDQWASNWLATHIADYSGWTMESFTPGSSLIVKATPNWGGTRGNVTRLVVQSVPTTSTRQQLISSGQADLVNGLEYDQYKQLSSTPGVKIVDCKGFTRDTLMLQTKTKPLNDQRVREAISLAIDRKALIEGAYAGFGEPATSAYPANLGFKQPSNTYSFDPAKAKQLLAQAGYPKGFNLTITYSPTRPGAVVTRSSVLLQSMLHDVGINVTLRQVASPTDFYTVLSKGQYQALMYSEPAALTDGAFQGYVFFGSDAPNNTTGFADKHYDALLNQLKETPLDQAQKRSDLMTQLAQITTAAKPILYLTEVPNLAARRDDVGQAVPGANGQFYWNDFTKGGASK